VQASPSSANVLSIPRLRDAFDGRVLAPDDPGYDQARTVFYGGSDRRPAVIVRPEDAGEVAKVVTLARDTGLELAVRSGAHSVAGHSVCDDGIVLDLANLRALDLDVAGLRGLRRAPSVRSLGAATRSQGACLNPGCAASWG